MVLGVDPPDPPSLAAVDPNEYEDATIVGDTDYRREELAAFLDAGAWKTAWVHWRKRTELDEAEYRIVEELQLIDEFDFFWDGFAERVGYHAPGISEDWREQEYHDGLDSWGTVSNINAELTELGQIVCDVLKEEYIDWESDYEPPEDLPEF